VRRWFASEGSGAYVIFNNGSPRKISVSQVSAISDASVTYSDFVGWNEKLASFQKLLDDSWRTRGLGDFWSHMLVAEGAVDVAIEPKLALWDMAALDVIVREAGGEFSGTNGVAGPFQGSGLSTNGILHKKIVEALS